ncbi:MAG TPA: twin-arginine translocation signal domain-containing protein, partial [Chthoniobacterales bacterium]
MKRREFLRATAALAAAGAISPAPVARSQEVPQPSPSQSPGQFSSQIFSWGLLGRRKRSRLFEDVQFNYVFALLLGSVYYKAADPGACLAIADQIIDGDRASAFRALAVAADR